MGDHHGEEAGRVSEQDEAPDDVTAAKASLAWGSQGNVSSETLRAFTEEEFRSIVAALP